MLRRCCEDVLSRQQPLSHQCRGSGSPRLMSAFDLVQHGICLLHEGRVTMLNRITDRVANAVIGVTVIERHLAQRVQCERTIYAGVA